MLNNRRLFILLASILIPGAGHVILRKYKRGIILIFWMIFMGFLTSHFAKPEISMIGRYSGGFAVWVLSVLDVNNLQKQ